MKKMVLILAISTIVVFAAIGIYTGEFKETWYNGATL